VRKIKVVAQVTSISHHKESVSTWDTAGWIVGQVVGAVERAPFAKVCDVEVKRAIDTGRNVLPMVVSIHVEVNQGPAIQQRPDMTERDLRDLIVAHLWGVNTLARRWKIEKLQINDDEPVLALAH
jgi:hypothetical protein